MNHRRSLAFILTTLFVATALAPLVGASTEATTNGDVVVNGAFVDARPLGHPLKLYCDANNPTPVAGPSQECAHKNQFVAFDWTSPVEMTEDVTLVDGGLHLEGNVFVQQHFNGSDAPDRLMQFFHVTLQGSAMAPGKGGFRLDIRADTNADGAAESFTKSVSFGTSPSTIDITAAALGLPAGPIKLRSVRVWADANADLVLSRVSVYATNGIDGRNIHILPAGDDVFSPLDAVALLNAGDDGKYTFLVGMSADNGDFLPTLDAFVCLYTGEQAIEDRGFPENLPVMCQDAYLKTDSPAITKTRVGDAFRFDIDASAVQPTTAFPSFALYATVKVDASYDIETPGAQTEFKTGYFNAARLAADTLDAGVSQEYFAPTPLFIDANADGKPDYVSTQDMDGYSVIITPQLSTVTPGLAVVTTDINGNYLFEVQVYQYEGATGAPMDLPGGISLGLFDAMSVANGGASDATPFWRTDDEGTELQRIDAKTWRVVVPGNEVPANTPIGAWAFYNVGEGKNTNAFGRSTSSTDFFSTVRNSVKEFAVADAMRTAMTPIILDGASLTRDATIVIRMDPTTDDLTALDGTLVAGDLGDGTISFEYAVVVPEGRTLAPAGHGLAIYDAAGVASDDLQPGSRMLEHAEWVGTGAPLGNGWFRVDVPVTAFADAKGPVGAWAYGDVQTGDGNILSRSGWYHLLKPAVAAVSTSAAEQGLYAPTPIVLLDAELGIPATLASAMAGAGTGLVSPTNPLVNPGFEANLLVEGKNDQPDNTGATMTTPPWFFRLDDKGTGQPTNPRSTHEVVNGKGQLTDSALQVSFHAADKGKSLMLGQLVGNENGGDALVWRGASSVSFDFKPLGNVNVKFTPVLRFVAADGSVTSVSGTKTASASVSAWQRVTIPVSAPAEAKLLGLYLVMDAPGATTFYLDNIVLEGAKTALGDARSDIADGFAVVIEPVGLTGATQGVVRGVSDSFYAYRVEVVDYTQGGAQTLELADLARSFALRTQDLQHATGFTLALRDETDAFIAFVPANEVPAPMAAPWAFVDAGPSYATLGSSIVNQPASGHYNPVKNAMAGTVFADQLDYAATPVHFGNGVADTRVAQQSVRLTPVPGGYAPVVAADTPYLETTTLTITSPNAEPRSFAVTLASAGGDVVPGIVLSEDDLRTVTLTTADTRFTRGAQLVAGSPIPSFEICRPVPADTCLDVGALTQELLTFRSTSLSPTGESLTAVWTFGDGAVVTESDSVTDHRYLRPGTKTVNLTVQTASGKRASFERPLAINNRAPSINSLTVTPSQIFVESTPRLRAIAADADGGVLSYAWTVDGVTVPGATTSTVLLNPSVLENTTGVSMLEKRTYVVGVTVSDGQGGLTSGVSEFTVGDHGASVAPVAVGVQGIPEASHMIEGDTATFATSVFDSDSVIERVVVELASVALGTQVELSQIEGATWAGAYGPLAPGLYQVRAVAYPVGGGVATIGPLTLFSVAENAAPTITLAGANVTEAGRVENYLLTASDSDGRGFQRIELLDGATLLGGADGMGSTVVSVPMPTMGFRTLTARVVDANGAESIVQYTVAVDDGVVITMSVRRLAVNATDSHQVQLRVTRTDGTPLVHELVLIEDFYAMIPRAIDTQELHTNANGEIIVRLAPEAVVIGMPLTRTIRATVNAESANGAPIQDIEHAIGELVLRNSVGPFAGLPLP